MLVHIPGEEESEVIFKNRFLNELNKVLVDKVPRRVKGMGINACISLFFLKFRDIINTEYNDGREGIRGVLRASYSVEVCCCFKG